MRWKWKSIGLCGERADEKHIPRFSLPGQCLDDSSQAPGAGGEAMIYTRRPFRVSALALVVSLSALMIALVIALAVSLIVLVVV